MTYSEKLKDPRWQKKRLEILERDKWTCQYCLDDKNTLHVHHKRYLHGREPWECPNELLETLCESCHEDEREMRPSVESDLLEMLKSHFSFFDLEEICNGLKDIEMVHNSSATATALGNLLQSKDMMNELVIAYFKSLKDKDNVKNKIN